MTANTMYSRHLHRTLSLLALLMLLLFMLVGMAAVLVINPSYLVGLDVAGWPAGLAMLVAARSGLPVHTHTPTEVKAAITGSGRADKAQVGTMVARLLRLEAPPKPADAADAVALAICHLWRGAADDRIAAALARQGRASA